MNVKFAVSGLALVLVTAGLAGCASEQDMWGGPTDQLSPRYGNAVLQNKVVHIVNPEGYAAYEVPPYDGVRASNAYGRYRRGGVEAVEDLNVAD
jgi:hypothetical protein